MSDSIFERRLIETPAPGTKFSDRDGQPIGNAPPYSPPSTIVKILEPVEPAPHDPRAGPALEPKADASAEHSVARQIEALKRRERDLARQEHALQEQASHLSPVARGQYEYANNQREIRRWSADVDEAVKSSDKYPLTVALNRTGEVANLIAAAWQHSGGKMMLTVEQAAAEVEKYYEEQYAKAASAKGRSTAAPEEPQSDPLDRADFGDRRQFTEDERLRRAVEAMKAVERRRRRTR